MVLISSFFSKISEELTRLSTQTGTCFIENPNTFMLEAMAENKDVLPAVTNVNFGESPDVNIILRSIVLRCITDISIISSLMADSKTPLMFKQV